MIGVKRDGLGETVTSYARGAVAPIAGAPTPLRAVTTTAPTGEVTRRFDDALGRTWVTQAPDGSLIEAQHELGLKFGTLTTMADHMQIYKYCIHNVANAYGKTEGNLNVNNATTAGASANQTITNDTTNAAAVLLTWVTANTGNLPLKVSTGKLTFVPNTGILTATGFAGALTGNVTGSISGSSNSALTRSTISTAGAFRTAATSASRASCSRR